MVISSQIFKAPSLTSRPKLTKTNVSSSVFRGIKSSTVSSSSIRGIKSQISSSSTAKLSKEMDLDSEKIDDPKYLQPQISSIDQTLVETNNILVEIQKQLAFDYAMRIAEEKDAIKSIKEAESKRKFAAKEKSIEGIKKIGGAVGGTINKIAAPIKGIFDRIKEFFGLILTSLIASAAFKWLENEDNINNLIKTFEFIGKTLPFLLGGLLTYKLIKWGRRLFLLGRFLWRLPGRITRFLKRRILGGGSTSPKPNKPVGSPFRSPSRYRMPGQTAAGSSFAMEQARAALTKSGANFSSGAPKGNIFQRLARRGANATKTGGGNPAATLATFLIGDVLNSAFNDLSDKAGKAFENKIIQDAVDRINKYDDKKREKVIEEIKEKLLTELEYQKSPLYKIEKGIQLGGEVSSDRKLRKFYGILSGLGFNRGGTVPGKGSGSVDSVNTMLAPGEEVVKTASARLFRPLLKDINDNAGRLWSAFSMGINKLMMVAKQQEDVNKEFARVIEDQERYQEQLKTEKLLKKVEGRGGGYRSPAKITPKAPKGGGNISMIPQSSGGMIFQPMVLPTQRSKPPQVPEMSGPATQAPNIASANPANPYMMLTPELYGILM